jgi:hypothetical protein
MSFKMLFSSNACNALWDPRVGKENRESAEANCALGMKIVFLHPINLYTG